MPKPLILDLPYPTVTADKPDLHSARIISFAYATQEGELTAILQYNYHSLIFEPYGDQYSELLESIAIAEMIHLRLLGQCMLTLGLDPRYTMRPDSNRYYSTEYVSYSTQPTKMVMDDYRLELEAIATYDKMLNILQNEQVSALIARIKMDEELHAEELKKMLQHINDNTHSY